MLLRTCPRCGDFFEGDAPPFCPSDGTPLADVDPRAEGWEEGARVVEEKTRSMLRRSRRLKLRRVLMAMMTTVVTTMVVLVVVANAVIYLRPEGPEAPAAASVKTPQPAPARGRALPGAPTTADPTLLLPLPPADAPTGDAGTTPDTPRPDNPTPTPAETSTPEEKGTETPTPTLTPTPPTTETTTVVDMPPPPRSPTPTPTPTPTTTVVVTPPPPPPPAPTCTGDDKQALRAAVAARSSDAWEEAIGREQLALLRDLERRGAARAGVNLLGPVVYSVNVSKNCVPTTATAVYFWRVRWVEAQAPDRPENRNQRPPPDRPHNGEPAQNAEPRRRAAAGERTISRMLTFPCSRDAFGWRCP